ncbi:hypothetical protein [Lysobacter solisilvae (ex Woo and Kim 2020)]|uniref:Uncharacterized protein n=1 Tax=Agrilutibacter terrestris TaxID=2865112 RepID=A0A7H0FX57_9GAMM|nr:hypothetical protein [Lysobacter terrestris]QNP40623.1 hypothetical protein H8B22_14345 [Lysobacter terrestris]
MLRRWAEHWGRFVIIDITCRTDRFNLSIVGPDFINDCCFGEDFSRWLVAALPAAGVQADVICMEDFGWANQAEYQGITYLMCVAGNSDEDPQRPNQGEWHVMLERQRSFAEKLLGRNRISRDDAIVDRVVATLREAGYADVSVEA